LIRSRLAAPRAFLAVVLVVALSASALLAVTTAGANSQEVLVGRYVGSTDQQRGVEMRVEKKDGKLVVASFQSSMALNCPPAGATSSTFGARPGAAIGGDGKVEFGAAEGAVKVSIILGGEVPVGRIDYSSGSCHFSSKFTAYIQPPDPIVTAGRYFSSGSKGVEMHVTEKRGYFELTDFSGRVKDCARKVFGIDAEPKAFIEEDGQVEFTALGGRARVEMTFHHKVHVQGRVVYSHGGCTEDETFAARLAPTP
jgi:hypothetical protein